MNGFPESPTCEGARPVNPIILTEKRNFIVYKITNLVNGKVYIGQTIETIIQRKNRHFRDAFRRNSKCAIHRAIRKYGTENFMFEILCRCLSKNNMDQKEKELIKIFNSKSPKGYNLTDGGEGTLGYKPTIETRRKLRETKIGDKNPMWGKSSPGMMGKNHTKESRNQMSVSRFGKKNPTMGRSGEKNFWFGKKRPDVIARNKLRVGNKHPMFGKPGPKGMLGKHHTDESCKKISEGRMGEKNPMWGKPSPKGMLGKHHSTETRRKQSEAIKNIWKSLKDGSGIYEKLKEVLLSEE